jgi:hypothetical protein
MPRIFDELGVRFVYPDNWALERQDSEIARVITVSSPGGPFWCLSVLPPDADLAEAAQAMLDGLQAEYDDLDAEAVIDDVIDRELLGYDVNFFCLDLTSTAEIRSFQTSRATYTVLWQAEDRDLEEIVPVFGAITTSLVQAAYAGE